MQSRDVALPRDRFIAHVKKYRLLVWSTVLSWFIPVAIRLLDTPPAPAAKRLEQVHSETPKMTLTPAEPQR
jgi:hypothetical protein